MTEKENLKCQKKKGNMPIVVKSVDSVIRGKASDY